EEPSDSSVRSTERARFAIAASGGLQTWNQRLTTELHNLRNQRVITDAGSRLSPWRTLSPGHKAPHGAQIGTRGLTAQLVGTCSPRSNADDSMTVASAMTPGGGGSLRGGSPI